MSQDLDYLLALELQSHFEEEEEQKTEDNVNSSIQIDLIVFYIICKSMIIFVIWQLHLEIANRKRKHDEYDEHDLNATQNLVNEKWESIDPTPDIFTLFGQFNVRFFQKKLDKVDIEWSTKMTKCAGICYSRRIDYEHKVVIRLSEKLLKFRSRRDLIETLLVSEIFHRFSKNFFIDKSNDYYYCLYLIHIYSCSMKWSTPICSYNMCTKETVAMVQASNESWHV